MVTRAGWPGGARSGSPPRCAANCPAGVVSGCWRAIVGAVFTALSDPAGVIAQRRGALQRAGWVLEDWRLVKIRLAEVETQMVAILDELELTELVTSIPGV